MNEYVIYCNSNAKKKNIYIVASYAIYVRSLLKKHPVLTILWIIKVVTNQCNKSTYKGATFI